MNTANKTIMIILGIILIAAAILKAQQILTTVIPTLQQIKNQYSGFELFMRTLECREIMIFHVPLELGLGIWLICPIFRKIAWLLAIVTFIFFSLVTAYKLKNGFADCGCFGNIKIDPAITLFAIDIPAVIALVIFRPTKAKFFQPPTKKLFLSIAIPTLAILIASTAYLLAAPPVQPDQIEQAGTQWDKLPHIQNSQQLQTGMWVILLFHHDCPDCKQAIPNYLEIAPDFQGSISFAFIEVPPYGDISHLPLHDDSAVFLGKLDQSSDWLIQTPRTILLVDGTVIKAWDAAAPTIDQILQSFE